MQEFTKILESYVSFTQFSPNSDISSVDFYETGKKITEILQKLPENRKGSSPTLLRKPA